MLNIFISYSSQNREAVEILAADLAEMGYAVWYDHELTGGHPWWTAILQRIRQCDMFVFAVTPASLSSIPCQREYEYAHALHKRILPVWLEDVDIRILAKPLQIIQVVDYRERTHAAILKLSGACVQLPPAEPLPDKMPREPEVPLSALAYVAERVSGPTLELEKQRLLVSDLRELLVDPSTAQSARQLLEKFAARDDLFGRVEKELAILLNSMPPIVSVPKTSPNLEMYELLDIQYPSACEFVGHEGAVYAVSFSPDGRYLLTGGEDNMVRLWDVLNGKQVRVFEGHTEWVACCAFSRLGGDILTGSADQTARLWGLESGQEIWRSQQNFLTVNSVGFSIDDREILTASHDKTVLLHDRFTGSVVRRFEGHTDYVIKALISPNGKTLVTLGTDETVRLWDFHTGREIDRFNISKGHLWTLAISPNGQHFAVGGQTDYVSIWDVRSHEKVAMMEGHSGSIPSLEFSPDGKWLVTGSFDRTVRLWDVVRGKEIYGNIYHKNAVTQVAFSPNGRAIASASEDGTAWIWSLDRII